MTWFLEYNSKNACKDYWQTQTKKIKQTIELKKK